MVQIIVGQKGKGKTKELLDKVNRDVKTAAGNVVYLDRSTRHMYELNNKVRLIDISQYMITNTDEFIGFIAGMISQDHDLEMIFLDNFRPLSFTEGEAMVPAIAKLEELGNKYKVTFVMTISLDISELPESLKDKVILSL